jgi:hypothetical protein
MSAAAINTSASVGTAVVEVSAVAVDVSASIANMSAAVANVSAAVADVSAAILDVSAYFVDMSAVSINVSADGNVANANIVPVALNHATLSYNNIITTSWHESIGQSVEPSNVTGNNNQHKMWIRQVMMDDWGVQYPHEFQLRAIHHVAFHHDQIVYIIAMTGSGKLAIPLPIRSLQTGVTCLMVPLVGLGSDQVNNSKNSKILIEAYHLDKNRGCDGYALRSWLC